MPLKEPRKLTPLERYKLKEWHEAHGLAWDDRGEWTSFTEDELIEFLEGS